MKIPRPNEESVKLFRSLVPKDTRVTVRPMFGNLSAFVNGNMFFGVSETTSSYDYQVKIR
jgi:TfoX/Sxy family transcriptional regulator of competence genes